MLRNDTVIYSATIGGENISVTWGDVQQSDDVLLASLASGVRTVVQNAATNKSVDETPESAKLRRVKNIKDGEMWSRGGGHALSDAEYYTRAVIAEYAGQVLALKRKDAEEAARKDAPKTVARIVEAILRAKDGKKPGKERLENAIPKFWEKKIDPEVTNRLQRANLAEDFEA